MLPTYVILDEVTGHDARLHGVHRTCAETAAVSRGTSHVTSRHRCKYTTSVDIQKVPVSPSGTIKFQLMSA